MLLNKEQAFDPDEFLENIFKQVLDVAKNDKGFEIEKTPIYKAAEELKQKIEAVRQQTIKTVKMTVPQKDEEEIKEQKQSAMDAAFRFIISPDDVNAKNCIDVGNTCPDTPEGLLCLICFWCFGNLTPDTKNVIKTPPGLAANGVNSLLLMCSLAKGGTRSLEQRVEHYFNIGREVCYGINNFSEYVVDSQFPHNLLDEDGAFDGYIGKEIEDTKVDSTNTVHEEPLTENIQNNRSAYVRFKPEDMKADSSEE